MKIASDTACLSIGWITLFVVGTDLFVISPLLPEIAHQFLVVPGRAGDIVAAFSLAYAVAAPALGILADQHGHARVLIFGLSGFLMANLLTASTSSFAILVGSRLLAGASAAAITPCIYALVGGMTPADRRGRYLSIVGSGLLLSLVFGAPLGAMLGWALGWRAIFVVLVACTIILVPTNLLIWPRQAHRQSSRLVDHRTPLAWALPLIGLTTLWGGCVYGAYTYLGSALSRLLTLGHVDMMLLLSLYGIGAVMGSLGGGWLADRCGARVVSSYSFLALALALLALAGGLETHAPVFMLGALLATWSLGAYSFFPAIQTCIVHSFPNHRGTVLAWNNSALYVGISAGAAGGGIIYESVGFVPLVVVIAVIAIASAGLSYLSHRMLSKMLSQLTLESVDK